jgi:hypothetical protein
MAMMNKPDANPRRPRLLLVLTAGLALIQGMTALRTAQVPADLVPQLALPLPFQFVMSIGWCIGFLIMTVLLWRRTVGAVWWSWALIGAWSIFSTLRLLFFTQAVYDRGRLPFLIIAVTGWLIVVGLQLRAANRSAIQQRSE